MKNVLEYLEQSASLNPGKIAAIDEVTRCTYSELVKSAKVVGSYLADENKMRKPVVVFMEKSVRTLQLFMGIVYAGDFYVLVDPSFPDERIMQILGVLNPRIVITREEHREKLLESGYKGEYVLETEIVCEADDVKLEGIRSLSTDTDPLYGIFTSGSTGVPKGVLICHRSVIDFIDCFTGTFGITGEDVIGNQAPFDFDVSVKDIYSCLKTGATLVIIPKAYFMFPNKVTDMLDDNKVTTLIWAVSALVLLNRLHALKYKVPSAINKIMFSGEVMPIKQLNAWRSFYPNATFVNLYGPTEITCNCMYYVVDREFADDGKLPMGKAFDNERVFLLSEEDKLITDNGEPGEICVVGTALALGYYNNPKATQKAFVQNPLCGEYNEMMYRTGDLGVYENGEMYFAGRKDFQIKHMGHRIELEEVEMALNSLSCVDAVCVFFDEKKNRMVAYYVGTEDKGLITEEMKKKVPDFMIPNLFVTIPDMPLTKNGKTDRKGIRAMYEEGRR